MNSPKLKLTIAGIAFVLASLCLTITAVSNSNYLSGQIFQLVGEKIGIVQSNGSVDTNSALTIPVPVDEKAVPSDFKAPAVSLSASVPPWGDGNTVIKGTAVK